MPQELKYKNVLACSGLFYSAAIWGSTFFIVKQSLAGINPVILVGYRFAIAAFLLGIILAIRRKPLFVRFREGIILGVFIWVLYLAQTIGLEYTSAANSGLITGLFVAFVPLFSLVFLSKTPPRNGLIAVLVSLGGLRMLTGGLQEINMGDLITLVSAMAYAAHILLVDKYLKAGLDPLILSFQQFLFIGAASLLCGLLFGLPFSVKQTEIVWTVLFLALFPTLSAFVIQLAAQKFTAPVTVSLILAFEPVFAAIFAWTFGHEKFSLAQAGGGFMIFAAIVISSIPERGGHGGEIKKAGVNNSRLE